MELSLGWLEMKVDEFWDITPRMLQLKMQGKREADYNKIKVSWEQVRFQTVCLINKDRKMNQQIKPSKLIEFEWEKQAAKETKIDEISRVKYMVEKERKRMEKIKKEGGAKSEILTGVI